MAAIDDRKDGRKQRELVVETGVNFLQRQDIDAGAGQLDGQRNAIQPAADVDDNSHVFGGEGEVREDTPRPLGEQPNRVELAYVACRKVIGRQLHRRHRIAPLAGRAQRLATRRQDADLSLGQHGFHQVSAGAQNVFAVIQHQQEMSVAEQVQQPLHHRAIALLRHTQDLGHGLGNQRRIGQPSKFNPVDAVRVPAAKLRGDAQGETGLAAAGRAGQCERARSRE